MQAGNQSPRYRRALAVLAVALLSGLVIHAWLHPRTSRERTDHDSELRGEQLVATQADVKPSEGADADVAPTAQSLQTAATPPNRLTTATEPVPELIEKAEQGEARAACFLARRMQRCREAKSFAALAEAEIHRAAQDPQADRSRVVVSLQKWSDRHNVGCDAFQPEQLEGEWRYLVQSAGAGNIRSMFDLMTEPPIDPERPLEEFEKIAWYRENAWPTIQRMVTAGSVEGLVIAYSNSTGRAANALGRLRERNPQDLLLYGAALTAAGHWSSSRSEEIEAARAEIPLDQRLALEARGRELGRTARRMYGAQSDPGFGCD